MTESPWLGPGFSRLKDGRRMCSVCFEYRTRDQLHVDDQGDVWDVCAGQCAKEAGWLLGTWPWDR